jgi:hypothetical protein
MDETVEPAPAPDAPAAAPEGVAAVGASPAHAPGASGARPPLPTGAALVLASLCAGAGIIHLVMAPIHASSSAVEAAAIALAGWVQLGLAVHLLVKPTRPALVATVAANVVFLLAWAVSRTVGLPVGAHPGAESVGAVDLICAVIEGAAVILAGVALVRPRAVARIPREGWALLAGIPVLTLLGVTLVVVSPSTAQHQHAETAATAAPVAARCDQTFNPRSYWTEAARAGLNAEATTAAGPAGDDHGHGDDHGAAAAPPTTTMPDPLQGRGSPKLDEIVSKLSSESEVDAAKVVVALADLTDQEYDGFLYQLRKANAGHAAGHGASGDDTGGHGGHMGPSPWIPMTDAAQCDGLTRELGVARETALRYPTAADATAAGWQRITPYVPGIAAHYMNFSLVDGRFEVDKPEMILYDGNGTDAHVVGLSYYIVQKGDAEPTQGFTGDNDHSHRHIGLCIRDGVVIADSTSTPEQCEAQGGKKAGSSGVGGWMSHAWVVPGCESPWGMFSGASPVLDLQLAQRSGQDGGACAGSKARARYDLSAGPPPVPAGAVTESAAGR